MRSQPGIAFYDFDGTLVESNVVTQYAYFARNLPSRGESAWRYLKLILSVPVFLGLDLYSRSLFNVFFYRYYGGMRRDWLEEQAHGLLEKVFLPALFPGAPALVQKDRSEGYRTVLVSGSLDFALKPVANHLGFDEVISNSLVYSGGVATGELNPPLIAEKHKTAAMRELCRRYNVETASAKAYSDSVSDLPMLEMVGKPAAVNPDRRLKRIAQARRWPVLNLKDANRVATSCP